ncbi:MAG: AbrB family transcriptional regulator [Opitutae bacterium]|nr:AbrB family transcriptional regulator [Opitutae bacterium]
MIKRITKVGNSQGIMLDAALMDLARLKVGDEVNITVHEGGAIYLTPVRPVVTPEEVTRAIGVVMKDYKRTMQKLA